MVSGGDDGAGGAAISLAHCAECVDGGRRPASAQEAALRRLPLGRHGGPGRGANRGGECVDCVGGVVGAGVPVCQRRRPPGVDPVRHRVRLLAGGGLPPGGDASHGIVGGAWSEEPVVLVVCSTTGDGVVPSDARPFADQLESGALTLRPDLHYSVLALGDKGYPHFCRAGKHFEALLRERSGQQAARLAERSDIDQEDWHAIEAWFGSVQQALRVELLHALGLQPHRDYLRDSIVKGGAMIADLANDVSRKYTKDNPYWATMVVKRPLTVQVEPDDKETVHIELDLGDSGIRYVPGDALGVVPRNCPAEVRRTLAALHMSGIEQAESSAAGAAVSGAGGFTVGRRGAGGEAAGVAAMDGGAAQLSAGARTGGCVAGVSVGAHRPASSAADGARPTAALLLYRVVAGGARRAARGAHRGGGALSHPRTRSPRRDHVLSGRSRAPPRYGAGVLVAQPQLSSAGGRRGADRDDRTRHGHRAVPRICRRASHRPRPHAALFRQSKSGARLSVSRRAGGDGPPRRAGAVYGVFA
eukprot:ctg_194.g133